MKRIAFSGNPLDRASYSRTDPAWLAAQRAAGLFLPFWHNRPFVAGGRAGFLPDRAEWEDCLCVFLGLDGGQPLFALDVPGDTEPVLDGGTFQDMRPAAFVLPARDTAIAGQAKALIDWHRRHGFCPNCGHATEFADGGYRRTCPRCGTEHFPRTDPVVIMLAIDGERCLLGRQARFPPGMWSCLAGFVEPGETIEEAVRRETLEEAGVACGRVAYFASQPWPFPMSLMIGCHAEALTTEITVDRSELEDARWFHRDEVAAMMLRRHLDGLTVTHPFAIAHHIIRAWLEAERSLV